MDTHEPECDLRKEKHNTEHRNRRLEGVGGKCCCEPCVMVVDAEEKSVLRLHCQTPADVKSQLAAEQPMDCPLTEASHDASVTFPKTQSSICFLCGLSENSFNYQDTVALSQITYFLNAVHWTGWCTHFNMGSVVPKLCTDILHLPEGFNLYFFFIFYDILNSELQTDTHHTQTKHMPQC